MPRSFVAKSPATTTTATLSREDVDGVGNVDSFLLESDDDTSADHQYGRPLSAVQRLGRLSIAILCLGSLLTATAVGFLIFLWTPSNCISWRAIASTAWLPRSVTLSALAIRIAVDLLTGLSASMIAAILLETESVYLGVLASISVMRAAPPSPWNLVWKIRHLHQKPQILACLVLSLLLSGLSLSLQFASTILLSDFRMGEVVGLPNITSYSYDLDWDWDVDSPITHVHGEAIYNRSVYNLIVPLTTQFAWEYNPSVFPTFGEYREPIRNKEGIDDTGYILRSFLPFTDAEERRKIKEFRGPTFVMDSRVSCQRPMIQNVSGIYTKSLVPGLVFVNITGKMANSSDITDLWRPTAAPDDNVVHFSCYRYTTYSSDSLIGTGPELCQIQGKSILAFPDSHTNSTVYLPTEGAGSLRSQLYDYKMEDPFPSYGPTFLLMAGRETINQSDPGPFTKTTVPFGFENNATIVTESYPQSDEIFFSLCYTSWESSVANVEMEMLSAPANEPQIAIDKADPLDPFKMDSILKHYGLGSDIQSRAVLDMKKPIYDRQLAYPLQQPRTSHLTGIMNAHLYGSPASLTLFGYPILNGQLTDFEQAVKIKDLLYPLRSIVLPCVSEGSWTMEFSPMMASTLIPQCVKPATFYQDYFTQAMRLTNNSPALTISGLLTLFTTSAYYDLLPVFSRTGIAQIVSLVSVSYPQSWNGLASVISLLAAFMLTCAVILSMFLSRTHYSRIGNSWSSVSQVYGSMTDGILRNGTMLSDTEVEKSLLERHKEKKFVKIARRKDERGCELVSA